MDIIEKVKRDLEMSGLKQETCEGHIGKIKVFLKTKKIPVEYITLDDVREFLRHLRYEKNYSIGTVNNYRSAIKYFYEVTLDKTWSDKKIPRLRGYKPLPSVLSKSEVVKFIEAMPNKMYRIILYTMYSSGLRVGEAVALRVKDLDSQRMQIYVEKSKNGSARYAILSHKNLKLLRDYVREWKKRYRYSFSPENYLFPSPHLKGEHISKKTIKNRVSELTLKINFGKNITSHSLRHAFGSHLFESGVDIFCIKELMGHRSIQSTNVYVHLASLSSMNIKSPFDEGEDKC